MKIEVSLLLVLILLFAQNGNSQIEKAYDSVVVFQKNYDRNQFVFNPPSIQKIKISKKKPRRATYPAGEVLEDIGRVGLTMLMSAVWGESTEFSSNDEDEVNWVLTSNINYPIGNFNWKIQLFTGGTHYKDFYAVGESLNSDSDRQVLWEESTKGIVLNQMKDTISRFVMLLNPDINKVLEEMAPKDFEEIKVDVMRELISTFRQGGLFSWHIDFTLIGTFRGEDFAAVASEEAGKFWIFKNRRVEAILQIPEQTYFSPTDESEERHLLISKGNNINQFDYLRLSLLYYVVRSYF
jgi:hypothetical protein